LRQLKKLLSLHLTIKVSDLTKLEEKPISPKDFPICIVCIPSKLTLLQISSLIWNVEMEVAHKKKTAKDFSSKEFITQVERTSLSITNSQSSPEGFGQIEQYILRYAANPIFQDIKDWTIQDNPYRRPIRPQDLASIDFKRPLSKAAAFNYSGLAAHRMLLNIYESDFVFLPNEGFAAKKIDFDLFYSNQNRALGEWIRPTLEDHVFGFLDQEVNVSGQWTVDALKTYLWSLVDTHQQSESAIADAILASTNPKKAAISFLIQVASDFLSESSPAARIVLGTYGTMLSDMFKIIIDEYGYGVHKTKHSSIFEETMINCGLSPHVHTYWQFYLSSWSALINYFHYLSRDHSKFFKFIGLLFYTEATLGYTCRLWSKMMKSVFGSSFNTLYFDEHTHIDEHHGRMMFENLLMPAIARYGDIIIEDLVRGIEEYRLLQEIADADFIAQVKWSDQLEASKLSAQNIYQKIQNHELKYSQETFVKPANELTVTRTYDTDQLLVVESGTLELVTGHLQAIELRAGEEIIIPQNRSCGLKSGLNGCTYHLYDLVNFQ
jgi:hypothetical protein